MASTPREAVENVRFGYAGRSYEIDLNDEHAADLDEALAPYIEQWGSSISVFPYIHVCF